MATTQGRNLIAAEGQLTTVVIAPAPFQPRVERLEVEAGMSITEILLQACQEGVLDPQDLCRAEVDIDGVRVMDREAIHAIYPLPGQVINVTVQVYGGGGGRGGNKALQSVLQVAIMVAAFAVAGPAGTALGNAVGFANGVGNSALFAAGQMAGQIAASTPIALSGGACIEALV